MILRVCLRVQEENIRFVTHQFSVTKLNHLQLLINPNTTVYSQVLWEPDSILLSAPLTTLTFF